MIALGTLALLHTKDAAQVNKFLEALPLKGEGEAQVAHELLIDQVLAGNQALTSNGQTQPALNRIREAVAGNEDLLTEEGREKLQRV